MVAEKTINARISGELHQFIKETIKRVTPLLKRVDVLDKDEELSYVAASRIVAIKLRKYTIPFTEEIMKELVKAARENQR